MKKILLQLILIFAAFGNGYCQIPPYHAAIYDSSKTTGYYFLVPSRFTNSTLGFHSQLILDRYGDVVYYRSLGTVTNSPDFKVQPNGLITYYKGQKFYVLDSTFTIIDSVSCQNGVTTDSHDLQILPNGHFLLLGYETVVMDLSAYAWFKPTGAHGSNVANVKCNVIQELDSAKNVVFEWHCSDHFAFADVDSVWLSNPFTVDWTHSNAVSQDYDGNFLLSSRHFNEITKINRSDSSIMWRLGGVQNQFTFLNDTTPFYGQHDIRRIANGHVTLFDNGFRVTTSPYHWARAMEYQLDEVNKTASVAWSYTYDTTMYSKATGNVQRLPNGNTLVDYGYIGSKNVTFVVVDSLGNKDFELAFDDSMASYRTFNFQQLPCMFHRPEINCIDSAGTFYLDAGDGYDSYSWNTGDTTRMIPVTAADTFFVFVPYGGDSGFISSQKLIVTDVADPCSHIGVPFLESGKEITVFPNPAGDQFTIQSRQTAISTAEIFNALGKKVLTVKLPASNSQLKTDVDTRTLSPGIYFLRITAGEKVFTLKIVKS